jgi:hypothetical protein
MKINTFWLEGVLLSSFFMISESMYCRFRIGLEKAKKLAWNGRVKKTQAKLIFLFLQGPAMAIFGEKQILKGPQDDFNMVKVALQFH